MSGVWRCGDMTLDLGRTRVMGVVNVTPDSFSDGGLHASTADAVAWGLRLLDDGADVLDVGGESTRPGFTPVAEDEEIARVVPVVRELAAAGALVSVDTRHAPVARAALEAGARIVNDVSGFSDPAMVEVVRGSDCGCVLMHAGRGFLAGDAAAAAGLPCEPAAHVAAVRDFLAARAAELEAAGVARERVCLDPGPGFGTTPEQDVAVQRATAELAGLGHPYLCAVSRKRFVGAYAGANPAAARNAASVGAAVAAALAGASIVRVHDVAQTADALRLAEACSGRAPRRRAYVALGSNMGERVANLEGALRALAALPSTEVVAASRAYETAPAYYTEQDAFANAVVEVATELHPMALLEALLGIEAAAGRVRGVENGPRVLDLDLLWMEGERHAGRRLALPHPLMGERDFVLRPLADLVGDVDAFCAREGVARPAGGYTVGAVERDLGGLTL